MPFPLGPLSKSSRQVSAFLLTTLVGALAHAYDYGPADNYQWGPFTLNGFAKFEATSTSNTCSNCQRFPTASKDESWADELIPGTPYGTSQQGTLLIQPWLGAHFNGGVMGMKTSRDSYMKKMQP